MESAGLTPLRGPRSAHSIKGFRSEEITLVTTLTDAELYPARGISVVVSRRWTIETSFRDLKTTMKMEVLKCETVNGVLKELAVFVLIYNLVRLVMLEASRRQEVEVDRISFIDALRWLIGALPGDPLCHLVVNPHGPGRYEPRVRNVSPKKNYRLMNRPRKELKKALAA